MVSTVGKKPIIGLLGGIGSGKSTAASEFAKLGCAVIDADKITHQLLTDGSVRQEIVRHLGPGILDGSGQIDRGKLAEVVFSDAQKLKLLNRIVHRRVLEKAEGLLARYLQQGRVRAIVLDMPLLVEVGWDKRCDRLIFVDCRRPVRAERARKSHGLTEDELKIRENFQISLDNKRKLADNSIDNNSSFSALARQVAEIFSDIVDNC